MSIDLPEVCLVALIGASGAGKTSFAARYFAPGEVLSSDAFRLLVAGSEHALDANADTLEALYLVARKRLARGLLTVIDATNVQPPARASMVELAREMDVLPVAIVLNLPPAVLAQRHAQRSDRPFGVGVVRRQAEQLRRTLGGLRKEGFREVHLLSSAAEVDAAQVIRRRLPTDLRDWRGPFDFIGDVHGCLDELRRLLARLGYAVAADLSVTPPPDRTAAFVGDLVDRGPDTPGVLKLVMGMVQAGTALVVAGNHDDKLLRALRGQAVKVTHGLEVSLAQLEGQSPEFRQQVQDFLGGLSSHYVLDEGRLVMAHAGLPQRYQGRHSARVRELALYGLTSGQDDAGLPRRLDWASEYRGNAKVIYGHTPVARLQWRNATLNLDTGCVFGGQLSALRWPENELVSVAAFRVYAAPRRPLLTPEEEQSALLSV